MLIIVTTLILWLPIQDGSSETETQDPATTLATILSDLESVESYAFTTETKTKEKGFPNTNRGRRGGRGGSTPLGKIEGLYEKEKPLYLKAKAGEVFVLQDAIYKDGKEWKYVGESNRGQQGRGGRRGGRGGGGERELRSLVRQPAPHTKLSGLTIDNEEVDVNKKGAATNYVVTLSHLNAEAFAQAFSESSGRGGQRGGGQRGGRGGQRGAGGRGGTSQSVDDAEYAGRLEVSVDKNNDIKRIVVRTILKGSIENDKVERDQTTTIQFNRIGKTEVKLPRNARGLL